MAIIPRPNIDQTDKDFDSIRTRLYNLIESVFPQWTSQNVADFGNILVDLFAHVGDVLGYYLDNHAMEAHISTATQRRSLVTLSKLLGYTPQGATAATVECTITLDAVPANDVVFAAGTTARTLAASDPVEFQLLSAVTILASADPPTIDGTFEHSATRVETFPATGLADQRITLGQTPFLDDTEEISASNGSYTKVSTFLDSSSTDRHYTVSVDQNDRARIEFGDGTYGEIAQGTITVTYRTGGGYDGNVEANTIQKLVGTFTDELGIAVRPSIDNALASSGGAPRQTTEQIREEAPASLRTLNRTVSREDYETNALRVAGVARALMLTSNEDVRVDENSGDLYIVPSDGGTPTQSLLDDVETMVTVTYPNTLTFALSVNAAVYKTINITATVFVSSGYTAASVDTAIRASLATYFALTDDDGAINTNIDFGYGYATRCDGITAAELPFSDIYNAVRDATGVYKIRDGTGGFLLNDEVADVSFEFYEFPALGTITLIDGTTGLALV
jgi:hypothetical protein